MIKYNFGDCMFNKKILFILILLVGILAVSVVSAAENATEDIINVEDTSDDVGMNECNDLKYLSDENDDVLDNGKKTFTDLYNLISHPDYDIETMSYVVELKDDYCYDDDVDEAYEEGIIIEKPFIIKGNGHTIDGDKDARMFHIATKDSVQLIGIKFVRGNTDTKGGAIYVDDGGNCTAINCTFNENEAEKGGAIYNCTAINCTFNENEAEKGGAIYEGIAINCNFTKNHASDWGGAACYGNAMDCYFYANDVGWSGLGGAVYRAIVTNCVFYKNEGAYGGALMGGNATNCTFNENEAWDGGALMGGTAANCVFYKNKADCFGLGEGGALFSSSAINCSFIENEADYHGGAMAYLDAINCTFVSNYAHDYAGALYKGNATNCIFKNNIADDDDGGAMYGGTAKSCYFEGNIACDWGGAICDGTAINCTFGINEADKGSSMYKGTAIFCRFGSAGDYYDTNIIPGALVAYDFKSPYDSGEKLMFDLKVNGENYNGYNVSIEIVQDGTVLDTYYGLTGEGWTVSLIPGIYTARLRAVGYEDVLPTEARVTVISTSEILVENISTIFLKDDFVMAKLVDYASNPICNVTLKVGINGYNINFTTDGNGQILIPMKGIPVGTYDFPISYAGNEIYCASNASATATVEKGKSELFADFVSTTFNMYKDLEITLNDTYGNPIRWAIVSIDLKGVKNYTTDENGQIKVSTKGLPKGHYTAIISFAGNGYYNSSTTSASTTIDNTGNFRDLNKLINETVGNFIELEFDYRYNQSTDSDFASGIIINKTNLFIDGKGHIIDGIDLASIFKIIANNVTLYNVTLVHALNAVSWHGANGIINCSNFANHTGHEFAVISWYGNDGIISDSYFTNNTAINQGSVCWRGANGLIMNSNFTDNHGLQGGAISWQAENGMILACNFINNTATGYGGAINWGAPNGIINASTFKGNKAGTYNNIYMDLNPTFISLTNSTLEANALIEQIPDCTINSAATLNVYFDDGTNIGKYSVVLLNNGAEITRLNYNASKTYQHILENLEAGKYSIAVKGLDNYNNTFVSNVSMEFNVNKYNSSVTIDQISSVFVNQNVIVEFSVENRTNVLFIVKNEDGIVVLNDNAISDMIVLPVLGAGKYTITIINAENGNYYESKASAEFTVEKYGSSITIEPISTVYYTDYVVVNFAVENKTNLTYEIRDSDGYLLRVGNITSDNPFSFNIGLGNYSITIFNLENSTHYGSFASADFTVDKFSSSINIDPIPSAYVDDKITVRFTVDNRTDLKFELKDEIGVIIRSDEIYSDNLTFEGLTPGKYTITLYNIENYNYYGSNASSGFSIIKHASSVVINPIDDSYYGKDVTVSFTLNNRTNLSFALKDANDNVVRSGNISSDTLTISGLSAGAYTLTVVNAENATCYGSNASQSFNVKKYATIIDVSGLTTVCNGGKYLVATLKDEKGNVLKNVKVSINIDGKTKTLTTNDNGQIKVSINSLVPKTYNAKITFQGNDKYLGSTATAKVVVKKAKAKIIAKKKTFKKAKKVKKYTITLKSGKNPIKKVQVTIKIGKKTFKAKTNNKGKATFKIKKLNKKGTYKATIKFKGNKYYNKATKKVKITIK